MTNTSSRNIPCLFHSAACTGLIAHSPVDQKENIIRVPVKGNCLIQCQTEAER